MIKISILAMFAVIENSNCYLTQSRPTTTSDFDPDYPSSMAVDNDFYSSYSNTIKGRLSWISVSLGASYTIKSIFLFLANYDDTSTTICSNIYIGNSSNPESNTVCAINAVFGVYKCNQPLTGSQIGCKRSCNDINSYYWIKELRAYEGLRYSLTADMLSDTSGTVNSSLINALELSSNNLDLDSSSSSTNTIFQVDLGSSQSIKAGVIYTGTAQSYEVRFGDSSIPDQNPLISVQHSYGTEFLVERSGRYLSFESFGLTLTIKYIALIHYPCSLDCSTSFTATLVYDLGTTLNVVPICSGSKSATQGILTSTAPAGTATLTKNNVDNSFNIALVSSDTSLFGQTVKFTLTFTDASAIGICQPPPLKVLFKCATSVSCAGSGFSSNNINYFLTETTELTISACVVTPAICPNVSEGTLASTGSTTAPIGFAKITKNMDGSFKIVFNSSDVSKIGQSYVFTLGFSDSSVSTASLTLPSARTLTVAVKCTKIADCSLSVQSDIPFFIGQTKVFTIPACAISPSVCINTTTGSLASIGINTPAVGFATITKNANNSFKIQLSSNDTTIIQGQVYQFRTTFIASEAVSLTPPSNAQFSLTICKSASLVATPASVAIKQLQTPQTIELSNPTNPAACGSYTYTISPTNNFVVLNGSTITISPTLSTNPQTYTITATSTTVLASPALSTTTTISVVVGNCQVQTLTAAAAISNQDYVLGQPKILVQIPSLTQTPACLALVSYTLNAPPSFIQVEGTNVTLFGSDLTQAGTINVILAAAASGSTATIQIPFSVIARNCTPLGLVATPQSLALTQLQAPAAISLSQTAGPSQCGSYTFSISPANAFVVLSGATITASPLLGTAVQAYPITVTSTMIAVPQLSATTTITITVNKCWVTSFAATSVIPNQDYLLGQTKILVPIPRLSQNPNCEDLVSYALNSVPSFIKIEDLEIALFGSILTEAGTIDVVLTVTASVSGTTIQLPFTVIARNCTPLGLVATPSTLVLTQLQTPAAISLSQAAGPSQCGSYSFSIFPENAFVVLNGSKIIASPLLETVVQDYSITVTSTMIDTPQLSATMTITITVNKCWVTSFAATSAIPNQDYVLGQTKILIPIPSLSQTPACGDQVLNTLNGIPSFVQIEDGNVALFGADLTQAGTINAILSSTASVSGKSFQFPFQITAFDCTPVGFVSSITSLTLSQLSKANAKISQVTGPPICGKYIHALKDSSPRFVNLINDLITFAPQLEDPLQDYTITATSTMVDAPYLSSQVSIILTVNCIVQQLQLDRTDTTVSIFYFKMGQRIEIAMPNFELYPACKRTLVFRLDNTTNGYSANSYPSFLTYDETLRLVVLSGENKLEAGKTYTFKYIVSNEIEAMVNMEYIFSIEVPRMISDPPYFSPALQPKTLKFGEITSWRLPNLVDPDNDSFDLILVKLGSNQWITFELEQNSFDVSGKGSPKMTLRVDGKGAPGIYRFFIEVVDSGGAKLNTVQTIIIEPEVVKIATQKTKATTSENQTKLVNQTQGLNQTTTQKSKASTSENQTKQANQTQSLNQTSVKKDLNSFESSNKTSQTQQDSNSTNSKNTNLESNATNLTESTNDTIDSNLTDSSNITESNQTECSETDANSDCALNSSADQNQTNEQLIVDPEVVKESKNQKSNGFNANFDGRKAPKNNVKVVKSTEKVIVPKNVLIEWSLLEWGCGAELKFSEPMIIDIQKARQLFSFTIINSEDEKTDERKMAQEVATSQDVQVDVEIASDGRSIKYNVVLGNPYEISVGADINYLKVLATGDQKFLQGKDGPVILPSIPSLRRQLKAQVVPADVARLESTTQTTEILSKSSILISGLVSFLINGSLGIVWGLFGVLQNIGIMAQVNVNYPGNAQGFISKINQIAFLEVFPEFLFEPYYVIFSKNLDKKRVEMSKKFNQRFYQMGFETSHPLINMGQSGFFLFANLVWMILILFLPIICRCENRPCQSLRDKSRMWKKQLFWNGWIRFFIEIFQQICVTTMIRMTTFEFGTIEQNGLTIFAVFLFLMAITTLIGSGILIYKNRYNHEDKEFQEKYGEVLADIDPHSIGAAFYWVFFMLHRGVQVATVILLQDKAIFQIQLFLQIGVLHLIYIGWNRPYETASQNNLEIFNSLMTLLTSYSLIIFSDFTDTGKVRYQSAWNLIVIVSIVCSVNVGLQAKQSIRGLVLYCRTNYSRWKQSWTTRARKLGVRFKEFEEQPLELQNQEATERELNEAAGQEPNETVREADQGQEESRQVDNNSFEESKGFDYYLRRFQPQQYFGEIENAYSRSSDSQEKENISIEEEMNDSNYAYHCWQDSWMAEVSSDPNATFIAQANQHIQQQIQLITEENDDGSVKICNLSEKKSIELEKKQVKYAKVHPFTREENKDQDETNNFK